MTPPLTPHQASSLHKAGVTTVEQVCQMQPLNIMQLLGISLLDAHIILRSCCVAMCPIPETVGELLLRERELRPFIPTPHAGLTEALNGGLAPSITEVVGPAGSGKTQFCLSTMVRAATWEPAHHQSDRDARPPCVVLIETEGAFNPTRVQQIAKKSRPELYDSGTCGETTASRNLTSLLSRIIVYQEDTASSLFARIRSLENQMLSCESCDDIGLGSPFYTRLLALCYAANVRLIVIDSVAAPAWTVGSEAGGRYHADTRSAGDSSDAIERSSALSKQVCL